MATSTGTPECRHLVQFYGFDNWVLIRNLARYFIEGQRQGDSFLCIATPGNARAFLRQLELEGLNPKLITEERRLLVIDASETLGLFMRAGQPDRQLFRATVEALLGQLAGSTWRAYGEMVGILWERHQPEAAEQLEELWNEFLSSTGGGLLCGYSIDVTGEDFGGPETERIIAAHNGVVSAGDAAQLVDVLGMAVQDVLGKPLPEENRRDLPVAVNRIPLPGGEREILNLRKIFPAEADAVLATARRYYQGERRFQALIENSSDAVALLEATGFFSYGSLSAERLLAYSPHELRDLSCFSLLHPEDLEGFQDTWQRAVSTERAPFSFEARVRRRDGSYLWVEGTVANLLDEPDLRSLVLNFRGIARRKQAEAELLASRRHLAERERYLALVLDSVPECVKILGPQGDLLQINPAGLGMLEADQPEELLGKCFYERVDEMDRERFRAHNESVFAGLQTGIFEFRIKGLKGTLRMVESRAAPLLHESGEIHGALSITRDVSERKHLDERLRESARLESLGILAGGIAHDFNNLLTGIMAGASILETAVAPDSSLYPPVSAILEASGKASQLTRQMLAYSGRGHFIVRPLCLATQVKQILALLHASIPKQVQLNLDLDESEGTIEADPGQLQQLVMNLVINAAEAIPAHGEVFVSTSKIVLPEARQTICSQLQSGEYVLLEVRDTGAGISEANRNRIFDPFFTTKFTGRGLGLSAVLGIIKGHRAGIEVESKPGVGTLFRVLFPSTHAQVEDLEPVKSQMQKASGTILFVDDEAVVRKTGKLALERLGYKVLLAVDGKDAVEQFLAHHSHISLVVLDMSMPAMSGEDTLPELKRINATVPVLASSGYTESEAQGRFGDQIQGFLAKPYTSTMLSSMVASTLRAAGRQR